MIKKERFPEAESEISLLATNAVAELGKRENKEFLPDVIPALKQKAATGHAKVWLEYIER